MPNKFVSFLSKLGHEFKVALDVILPFAKAANVAVSIINPALGGLIQTSLATVISVEQKFAAAGNSSGSGAAKLADALTILYPAFESTFASYGVTIDKSHVENYINALVAALNAFPALPTNAQPVAPASAAPATSQAPGNVA